MSHVIVNLKNKNQLSGLSFLLIFSLFMLNNTIIEISGIRFTTALAFATLFFYYNLIEHDKKKSYMFLILATLSHFSMVIIPVVMFIRWLFWRIFQSRKSSLILLFVSLISGLFLVKSIIALALIGVEKVFNIYIGAATYTSGEWGEDRTILQGFSAIGMMIERLKLGINVFIPFALSFIFIISHQYNKSKIYQTFIVFTIVFNLFIPFDTVYLRYQSLLVILALMIYANKNVNIRKLNGDFFGLSLLSLKVAMQIAVGFLSTYVLYINNLNTTLLSANLSAIFFNLF